MARKLNLAMPTPSLFLLVHGTRNRLPTHFHLLYIRGGREARASPPLTGSCAPEERATTAFAHIGDTGIPWKLGQWIPWSNIWAAMRLLLELGTCETRRAAYLPSSERANRHYPTLLLVKATLHDRFCAPVRKGAMLACALCLSSLALQGSTATRSVENRGACSCPLLSSHFNFLVLLYIALPRRPSAPLTWSTQCRLSSKSS